MSKEAAGSTIYSIRDNQAQCPKRTFPLSASSLNCFLKEKKAMKLKREAVAANPIT